MWEEISILIKIAGGAVCGAFVFFFGAPDVWMYALVAFVVMDYITAVAAAVIEGTLSSRKGLHGILRKVISFVPVAVGHILDNAVGLGGVLRGAVIGFLVANEGISLLENTARCGVKWPQKLMDVLEQLKGGHQ